MVLEFSTIPIGKDDVPSVVIANDKEKSRPFISIIAAWEYLYSLYLNKQITPEEFLVSKERVQRGLLFVPGIEWLDALIAFTYHVFPNFPDTAEFTS